MKTKKWQIVVPEDFESTDTQYRINDKYYNRVTNVLGVIHSWQLTNWKVRVGHAKANKIIETRQQIGTHVHNLIEKHLKGKDLNLGSYETEIQEGMCKFYEFEKLAKLKPEGLEQRLWSNDYSYAGTADYIGYYTSPPKNQKGITEWIGSKIVDHHRVPVEPKFPDGAFVIGDWKTSRSIYPKHWLQLAAYAMAFKELTGIKVDGAFVLQIRDGRLHLKEMTWDQLVIEFEAFKHVVGTYQWQHKEGMWKNNKP